VSNAVDIAAKSRGLKRLKQSLDQLAHILGSDSIQIIMVVN